MNVVIKEATDELGVEEKMIALKILLVIYLHDKRYAEALSDIEELLNDPEMEEHREYLLLRQKEVKTAMANASKENASFERFLSRFLLSLSA